MAPEIVIERDSGAILIGADDRLAPWERMEDVEHRVRAYLRAHRDHRNGYEWLDLDGFQLGGEAASLSLCFAKRRLEMVHWNVALPGATGSWPTREEIEAEVRFVRGVLAGMIGYKASADRMRLPWGDVWSSYDRRGDVASHGLSFRQ